MLKKRMSKSEIENELKSKGDFVKVDYLNDYLSQGPSLDMKKFAYLMLAEIYRSKSMFEEAAKIYSNVAILSLTFNEKVRFHLQVIEMYAKAGEFERADEALRMAISNSSPNQKPEIFLAVKEFYKLQAAIYEKEKRRGHATKMYEKLAGMSNLSDAEREEIRQKLLHLYEQLGRIREYMMLKGEG